MSRGTGRTRLLLAAALVVALAAAVGIAWAAIPSGGVYTGCYMKSGGSLRIIDASQQCKGSETRISWNEQGQPGPPGPSAAGALVKQVNWQPTETSEPLHLTGPDFVTLVSIPKPDGDAYNNASLIASINIYNSQTSQATVNCMLPGGAHFAFMPGQSLGTQTFSGLYMGGPLTEFTLRCAAPGSLQGSPDLAIGWATLTVVPASSAEIVMGHNQ